MALRQQHADGAVLDHVFQALRRIFRVEGHVRAPALRIPNRPTIMSIERSTAMPTFMSGFNAQRDQPVR